MVVGDLTDRESLKAALKDVRYLFHVAADYRLWARDPSEIMRANVEGTLNLKREALAAGVERIVYTSSVAALRVAGATAPVDETAALAPERGDRRLQAQQDHGRAGGRGHDPARRPARRHRQSRRRRSGRATSGRRRPAASCSTRRAAACRPSSTPGLNFVHVDDVAAGHLLAFEHGRIGERYILGGENLSLQDLLGDIAALAGRKAPRIKLPRGPLFPLAFAAEAFAHLTGKEPLLTLDGLRMSRYRMFFTSAKAERELGYRSRPYQEGVADALAWFRTAGYLT